MQAQNTEVSTASASGVEVEGDDLPTCSLI